MVKILLILMVMFSSPAWATSTWFIRIDGSTATNCTGLVDAAYPGSGTAQPCALNSPQWSFPPANNSTAVAAQSGDTVVIEAGSYRIGCQNAGTCRDATVNQNYGPNCDSTYPYQCSIGTIPSNVTVIGCSIIGCGSGTKPQLWGAGDTSAVLSAAGSSNVTISDFEITDHSGCGYRIGSPACDESSSGLAAKSGINVSGATSLYLKNLYIHGLGYWGMRGSTNGLTLDNVNIDKNPEAGWDSDDGNPVLGTTTFKNFSKITYSGCIEAYPVTPGQANLRGDVVQCIDMNASNGYGDAIGTHDGTTGVWIFQDCNISHNVQDGIDLLHSSTGTGSLSVYRCRFDGNNANSIKSSLKTNVIENSIIVGNCGYFSTAGISEASGFVNCRSDAAQPFSFTGGNGQTVDIKGSTIWSDYDTMMNYGSNGVGSASDYCNGSEYVHVVNSIWYGAYSLKNSGNNTSSFYCAGDNGGGGGNCCSTYNITPVFTYTDTYNLHDSPIAGTGNLNTDPLLNQGTHINGEVNTDAYDVTLTSSSPVRGVASSGVSFQSNSNDYQCNARVWDMGALIYGSTPQCSGGCTPTTLGGNSYVGGNSLF